MSLAIIPTYYVLLARSMFYATEILATSLLRAGGALKLRKSANQILESKGLLGVNFANQSDGRFLCNK